MIHKLHKPLGKAPEKKPLQKSERFNGQKFVNPVKTETMQWHKLPKLLKRMASRDVEKAPSSDYQFTEQNRQLLQGDEPDAIHANWLVHASLLLHHEGRYILTDPVLSGRASPFSFSGPKRFFSSPINIEDFPEIDWLVLSHDHYDHLDLKTLRWLQGKIKHFVAPMGVASHLRFWGIPDQQITELDWWESFEADNFKLTATPARHFTGRLFTQNNTLWCSYMLELGNHTVYFGGDSGIFPGFKDIGKAFPNIEASILPIGAYDVAWADIHLNPEEALEAHSQLEGGRFLPIHWGTYDLALHSWHDPIERLVKEADQRKVPLLTPAPGEWISLTNPNQITDKEWWKAYRSKG